MSMVKAVEIEIAFFHSLGNPNSHKLDYFFCAKKDLSVITSPKNWYVYRLVSWNVSEVINENQQRWIQLLGRLKFYTLFMVSVSEFIESRERRTERKVFYESLLNTKQRTRVWVFSALGQSWGLPQGSYDSGKTRQKDVVQKKIRQKPGKLIELMWYFLLLGEKL